MRILFKTGEKVRANDEWNKEKPRSERRIMVVTGYSDRYLKVGNPVVNLRMTSRKTGKTYYTSFHQGFLEAV